MYPYLHVSTYIYTYVLTWERRRMHAWHCGVRQAMLPIGSAFANGHLTSGLSSLFGREIKSKVHHRSYRLSSVQGGRALLKSWVRYQSPMKKGGDSLLAPCTYVHTDMSLTSFRCCSPETWETLSNQVSHRSGPSRVPESLDWSH